MDRRKSAALSALLAMSCAMAAIAEPPRFTFTGSGTGLTPEFEMDAPWLIDWRADSEFPRVTTIEFRLQDARSGQLLGIINQAEGSARGLKLLDDVGRFRVQVNAEDVSWKIDIMQVSGERAAQLRQLAEKGPSLAERSDRLAKLLPVGNYAGWQVVNDSTLLLAVQEGGGWSLSFSAPCEGLSSARGLSFVTPTSGGIDQYDSILLDDGTRCYFDQVAPTSVPEY